MYHRRNYGNGKSVRGKIGGQNERLNSLKLFALEDAKFEGNAVGKMKKTNIAAATELLFGTKLKSQFSGEFDAKLSHKIHAIIAAKGLIRGGGKVIGRNAHRLSVSMGHRHKKSSASEVIKQLDELFSYCNDQVEKGKSLSRARKFQIAAFFLYRYLAIHPYCDGNGRTARLLTSLLLMRLGAISWPVCFNLNRENRKKYIRGLNVPGVVGGPTSKPLVSLMRLLKKAARETAGFWRKIA